MKSLVIVTIVLFGVLGAYADKQIGEKQYDEIVKEIADFSKTTGFNFLHTAALHFGNRYPSRLFDKDRVEAPEAIATALLALYEDKAYGRYLFTMKSKFKSLLDKYVTKECAKVKNINDKLEECYKSHPEVDNPMHRVDIGMHSFVGIAEVCAKTTEANFEKDVFKVFRRLKTPPLKPHLRQ